VGCRRARWVWRAHRAWTAAQVSALLMAGTGMGIQSSGGAGRRVCPGPTGRNADGRTRAGAGRVRALAAVPSATGAPRIPRTEATGPRGCPRRVGLWAAVSRLATRSRVAGVWRSVYQAKIGATTAAFTGSSRRRGGSRGRSGATIDPSGATGQGSRWPRRHVAWRPRRLRSVIKVRAYSATAPRIWSSSCAWGA
jgi:hypothetical protein